MKIKSRKGPWVIIIIALLLVAVFLTLGNRSFNASEKASFDEFNQRQLVLARAATSGFEWFFENLAGDMRVLARLPEIQYLDEAPTRRELQVMLQEVEPWGARDVGVLDANGVLRTAAVVHEIEGVDFS